MGLTKRVRKLYKENSTKKYYLSDLILYVERKNFEIYEVKVLQPDIEMTLTEIKSNGIGKFGARALIYD